MAILSGMRHADIAETIHEDWLLLKFIKVFADKYAFTGNQENLICEKARTIARLYLKIKESVPDVAQFSDCFKGIYFDDVIDAVHYRTGKGDDIKTPSQALKIGHSLKKCCHILIGDALRKNNLEKKEEVHSFLELVENEWNEKVSKSIEASNITVGQYEAAKVSQEKHRSNKELLSSLSEAKKVRAKRLLLVEIRGKRGRKVPLLLPP